METIRFRTTISSNGTINIPQNYDLGDREADVIVFVPSVLDNKSVEIDSFVSKWAGILEGVNTDVEKHDYLNKKQCR